MNILQLLLCFSISMLVSSIDSKDSVPVLIWDSLQSQKSIPAVSALQVVSFASFQDKYLALFQSNNILLFLQDSLSVEDLSSHPSELRHVSKSMESFHSLYLPAVEEPSSLVHSLPTHGYKMTAVESGSSLGGLSLDTAGKNLVVIELPSTITNPSRKNSLQKSDEVIDNVLSKIGKMAPFTVIFTGKKPSIDLSGLSHLRVSRSLRQVVSDTATVAANFHRSDCVMLYLRSEIVVNKDNKLAYALPESKFVSATGDCPSAVKSTIQLSYKDIAQEGKEQLDKVKVEFTFDKKGRFWYLSGAEIFEQNSEGSGDTTLVPKKTMDKVPLTKSYSCGLTNNLYSNETGKNYQMILPGLQVEAFTTKEQAKFHSSWDCVGFFTIPIWTGIFTGLLLTFILLFGLYMLSDVKTMDRFDDPKGKHFMTVASAND